LAQTENRDEVLRDKAREHDESANHARDEIDSTLLKLAPAGLALTLTTARLVAPKLLCLPILFLSWFCFGLSIAAVLLSYWATEEAFSHEVKKTVEAAERGTGVINSDKVADPGFEETKWTKLVRITNATSISAFVLGAILFAIFSGINMCASKSETAQTASLQQQIESMSGDLKAVKKTVSQEDERASGLHRQLLNLRKEVESMDINKGGRIPKPGPPIPAPKPQPKP
jgi:hypothetical protein